MTAKQIEGWTFDDATHSFRDANGSPVPSLTQILSSVGISDYSSVPEKRLEYKRDIGDAVHYAARYLDEDRLDYTTLQPTWANHLVACHNFKNTTDFLPKVLEEP